MSNNVLNQNDFPLQLKFPIYFSLNYSGTDFHDFTLKYHEVLRYGNPLYYITYSRIYVLSRNKLEKYI